MVSARRFHLKAEVIPRPVEPLSELLPYARAWVDSGISHLDGSYDYGVSESFSDLIAPGVRIQVPFNGREVEAIVLERMERPSVSGGISAISRVISPHAVETVESLDLIECIAREWVTNPWQLLRSAVPPRVASVDRQIFPETSINQRNDDEKRSFAYQADAPFVNPATSVATIISRESKHGSVLVIAPDTRDIEAICVALSKLGVAHFRLDSSISRAMRYENYLKSMREERCVVVGARGAIFTPVRDLRTILVFKESSHQHYEIRNPGWNVRDIAILRRKRENLTVIFTGFVPSLDLSILIENGELTFITEPHRLKVKAFSSEDGSLLPGRIFDDIRKGLSSGPVLFLMPRKGYGNALLCAHCKNMAMCSCGGRLVITGKNAAPLCVLCSRRYEGWKCQWCQRDRQYIAARGIERAGEEIARAFPNFPTILSFGAVIKDHISKRPALVLATPGAVPAVESGYAAVVILEGLKFFSHFDLRAQERARELFFETSAMVNPDGFVLLCIQDSHPIVSAISRWNPGAMIRSELAERLEVPLPPYVSSAVLIGSDSEFTSIATGLRKAIAENRLASSTRFFGPTNIGKGLSKIVLYFPHSDSYVVKSFFAELQRRRSIAKKERLEMRIDPYSL